MAKETRTVHVKVTSNVSSVGKETSKATKQATGLKGALGGVGKAAALASGGIRAMTMALLTSGVGAIVVALGGMVALLTASMREAKEFSKSMSGLQAVLGFSKDEMGDFSSEAKRLGKSTAFTASQVVELQTEFAKLGFSKDEIINVTEATLDLAAASGTDLANAAMIAGSTLRALGLDSSQTGRVADVMAQSFNKSALNITTFQESMKMVAPIAKLVKVDLEQTSAALSILADNGIKGSMAGTSLRKVMSELATKTGVGFRESLELTKDRMDKASSTTEKLAIATELVGDRAKGSLAVLVNNIDNLDELEKAYDNSAGAAKRMADIRLDNLSGDITILKSAWSGMLLSFEDGEGLMSQIARGSVQALTTAIGRFEHITRTAGVTLDFYFGDGKDGAEHKFSNTRMSLVKFGSFFMMMLQEIKVQASKVPIIGKAIDTEEALASLKRFKLAYNTAVNEMANNDKADKKFEENFEKQKKKKLETLDMLEQIAYDEVDGEEDAAELKLEISKDFANRRLALENTLAGKLAKSKVEVDRKITEAKQAQEDYVAGLKAEKDKTRQEQEMEKRKKFLNALTKAEEDLLDTDDEAKIERRKQRHLAELEEIKATDTEKQELRKRIEEHYENLKKEKEKEISDKKKEEREKEATKIQEELEKENLTKLEKIDAEEQERLAAIAGLENFEHLKTKIEQDAANKRNEIAQIEADMKKQILMSSASSIFGSLSAISKKNAKVSAAFSVAQIMMNTYTGMAEIEKKFASPELASDRALKMIAKASVLAQGIAGVANIKKTASSVGVSAGGGSAPSIKTQAPSFNVVGQQSSGEQAIGSKLEALAGGALKAYVVESEVTNAQQLNNQVENTASLG